MSEQASPLVVDGARPAVTWVASIPRGAVTDRERVVLVMLACDAFENVSRPGGASLAQWAGLINGRLYETLKALESPTDKRPALIERVDRNGAPIPPGVRYGSRERTGYRLRTEHYAEQLSQHTGRVSPEPVDNNSPATPGELRNGAHDAPNNSPRNSPEQLSRTTLPNNSPGPPGDSLPFPTLPTSSSARSRSRATATPEPLRDDWEPNGTHLAVMKANGLNPYGLASIAQQFREAMKNENRRDWDKTFSRFIQAVADGTDEIEFPIPDYEEPTYSFDTPASRPTCEAHPSNFAARCPACISEVKAGQRNPQDVGRLIRDDEPRF